MLGRPLHVIMPDDNSTILNAAGNPAGYLETIATILDPSGYEHHATQTTDANRAVYLQHTGENYLYMPGIAVSNLPSEIGYHADMNIAGRMAVAYKLAPADWTPAAIQWLGGRDRTSNATWRTSLMTDGTLRWTSWVTAIGEVHTSSTVSTAGLVTDNVPFWIAFEHIPNNGSGNCETLFYTSPDGITWTQLGTTVLGTTHAALVSTAAMEIGTVAAGVSTNKFVGRFYEAKLIDGAIGGTPVVHWRAADSHHLDTGGRCLVGPGIMKYRDLTMLVGAGTILTRANSYYVVANQYQLPAHVIHGMRFHAWRGVVGLLIGFSTADNSTPGWPYAVYRGLNNNDHYFAATTYSALWQLPNSRNRGGNVVSSSGPSASVWVNGLVYSTPASNAVQTTSDRIKQLFRRAAAENTVAETAIGRMGVWADGTTMADIDTWLGSPRILTRNLIGYSENLNIIGGGAWTGAVNQTATPNVVAGPAEVSTALVGNLISSTTASSAIHYVYQSFAASAVAYCLSVYVKRPPSQIHRYLGLKFSDGAVYSKYAVIDTDTWASVFNDVGVGNITITDVGGGWYRCSCSWTFLGAHGAANIGIDLVAATPSANVVIPIGDGLYVTGAQLHRGTAPDLYFPTFADPAG